MPLTWVKLLKNTTQTSTYKTTSYVWDHRWYIAMDKMLPDQQKSSNLLPKPSPSLPDGSSIFWSLSKSILGPLMFHSYIIDTSLSLLQPLPLGKWCFSHIPHQVKMKISLIGSCHYLEVRWHCHMETLMKLSFFQRSWAQKEKGSPPILHN